MDDLISIIRKSIRELGSSPVLLMAGLVVGVLALPLLTGNGVFDETVKAIAVDFSELFLPLLIMPFFAGGALGYAVEVRNKGASSLSTFIDSGRKNYLKLLMAGVVSFSIFYFLYFSVLAFLLTGSLVDVFVGLLLGLIMLILAFLVLLAIEFYDIGIVADGLGVVASFRNSIAFVRRNLASAMAFFVVILVLKALVMLPMSFGMAGAMMTNETYYSAMKNASLNFTALNATDFNATALNSTAFNATALNSTAVNTTAVNATAVNATSLLSLTPPPLDASWLIAVGILQIVLQAFVFALLALFKAEFYLMTRQRKRITDFDYDFSDEKSTPPR